MKYLAGSLTKKLGCTVQPQKSMIQKSEISWMTWILTDDDEIFEENPYSQPMRLLSFWFGREVPGLNDGAMIVDSTELTEPNATIQCLNFLRVNDWRFSAGAGIPFPKIRPERVKKNGDVDCEGRVTQLMASNQSCFFRVILRRWWDDPIKTQTRFEVQFSALLWRVTVSQSPVLFE